MAEKSVPRGGSGVARASTMTMMGAVAFALAAAPPGARAGGVVTHCPGDANADGIVDFGDITAVLGNWLANYLPGTGPGDANADGLVDFGDITAVLGNWLSPCAATYRLDEPGTWHEPPASPLAAPEHGGGHALHRSVDYCATSIYAATGEFHHESVDLAIPGRGVHFAFVRKYRSRAFPRLNAPGAIASVMGNHWTHSYDIRIEDAGNGNLILHDGNSRADLYQFDPMLNLWSNPEFFREITRETDFSFIVRFAHSGTWHLHPLDGSPTAGKIESITDRNGNSIAIQYDVQGRVSTIADALDSPGSPREIAFNYNPDGLLESITDWAGRSVAYSYYQDGDAGGSFGDLESMTTPIVIATPDFPIPPGHEFPSGKTTTYTYSKGFTDERLNHNLLTITDPKGQTYLTNVYAGAVDPQAVDFDRVQRQVYGDVGDNIDFFYKRLIGRVEASSFLRVTINDRAGNVEEWTYDDGNRPTLIEEFTGRADPDLTTTDVLNRPGSPLRPVDPASFETRYEWEIESLPVTKIDANQNTTRFVYEAALNPLAPPRGRANLRETHYIAGPLGADQSQLDEFMTYDPVTNFVLGHTDARGNTTTIIRDPQGNPTRVIHRIPAIVEDYQYNTFGQMTLHIWPDNGSGHRREDVFTYYDDTTPQHGYLHERIADATALALTTRSTYDSVGNEIRFEDTKGKEQIRIYNQLYQCVSAQSRPVELGNPPFQVRYGVQFYYDANDMPVRIDVENIDETGQSVVANRELTTFYQYTTLNYVRSIWEEKNDVVVPLLPPLLDPTALPPSDFVRTEFEYDDNRNLSLARSGESTSGAQPNNHIRFVFDERDLLFTSTRGDGGPDQSTTQHDYDANGNVVRVTQGLEGASPRESSNTYDGYDRLTTAEDPMGNRTNLEYDANSNVVRRTHFGAPGPDAPGDVGDVRLRERNNTYDPLDRLTIIVDDYFDPITFLPLDDGASIRTIDYTDASMIEVVTDDRSHAHVRTYDTAIRLVELLDPFGNRLFYEYDDNSNVTRVTSEELNGALPPGSMPEVFVEYDNAYDALDRLVSSTDGSGNVQQSRYDSRDNLVLTIDPNGVETRFVYDPLDRQTMIIRDMNANGADALDPIEIVLQQIYDDNHRVRSRIDDNGNELRRLYDDLDREIESRLDDDSLHITVYDAHDNAISRTDANTTVELVIYDLNDRPTRADILVGPGVSNETTFEEFDWDGLNRLLRAEDDDSIVVRAYDSLDNMRTESQNGRLFEYTYDGVGNQTAVLYPSGVSLTRTYDELDRVSQVFESGFLGATYTYAGRSRLALRTLFNNTQTDYAYDGINGIPNPPGDFGFKQLSGTTHRNTSIPSIIDQRDYLWDPAQNKTSRADLTPGGLQLAHLYAYDDAYRLANTDVVDPLLTLIRNTQYVLDGVGNREQVVENSVAQAYFMDPTFPSPADRQVNQYSQTPLDLVREYDENGNLTGRTLQDMTVRSLEFNCNNQLVAYADPATGTSAIYKYDALGRRIGKSLVTPMGVVESQFTYAREETCDGMDDDCDAIVEEWDGGGTPAAGYIRSQGRPLFMNRDNQIRAYHFDDLGNTMALTDNFGNVTERYEYDDYGAPSIFDPLGNPRPETIPTNPFLYLNQFFDPETKYVLFDDWHLDPEAGRAIVRDPGCDDCALFNPLTFANDNPWTPHPGYSSDDDYISAVRIWDFRSSDSLMIGSGSSRGRASFSDLTVPKNADKSTPGILKGCCNGKHIPEAVLTCRKAGGDPIQYLTLDVLGMLNSGGGRSNGAGGGASNGSIWIDPDMPIRNAPASSAQPLIAPLMVMIDPRLNTGADSFRPPRTTSKPTVAGTSTAVVVGASGEEIYPDEYGRVKVSFPLVRAGASDDNSSCWIRVAQIWSGVDWGAIAIPEIGDEVLVNFMQGDPDRPIITGRVYNGRESPIYIMAAPRINPFPFRLDSARYKLFSPLGVPLRTIQQTSWKEFTPAEVQRKGTPRH